MTNIPISLVENECNLFFSENRYTLDITSYDSKRWESDIQKYCLSSENGIISIGWECLYEDKMNHILDCISKYNSKFKLHSSNISEHPNVLSPYTNIALLHSTAFFHDFIIDTNVDYNILDNVNLCDDIIKHGINKHIFLHKPNSIKTNKYIISARRFNNSRRLIFENINIESPTGIIRPPNTDYNNLNDGNYVNTDELMNEYSKSFISLILETAVDTNRNLGYYIPMTEKTIIGFHTNTFPIVLGNRGLNKRLTELGFWTGNELYNIFDEFNDIEENFSNIVNEFDTQNNRFIQNIYNDNLDKILNNNKIIKTLFNIGRKYNRDYDEFKYLYE